MEQSFYFLPLALPIVNEMWADTEIHLDLINHFLSEKSSKSILNSFWKCSHYQNNMPYLL